VTIDRAYAETMSEEAVPRSLDLKSNSLYNFMTELEKKYKCTGFCKKT
jgi:hypothetical protein